MENTPVINVAAAKAPFSEEERYRKWLYEAYYPLLIRYHLLSGLDVYTITKENGDYPTHMSIYHYTGFSEWENHINSTVWQDILKDVHTTFHRDIIWMGVYQIISSFHNISLRPEEKAITLVEDATILHVSGFKLSIEKEKFNEWFKGKGSRIYMPILMKVPGLKAVNSYSFTNRSTEPEVRDPGYPELLFFWYFDSLKSFHDFEESPELAAFNESIKSTFSDGLTPRWYVQYELFKSFRR
jgi:hypothetical protein